MSPPRVGRRSPSRAVAPAVGVVLLVLVTVVLAAVASAGLVVPAPEAPPQAAFRVSADATAQRIALTHLAGDPVEVTRLRLRVVVDGEPLAHQPPVPFFAATGFEAGPTGPFNVAADPTWEPGETAAVRLAGTNAPPLREGSQVVVEVYVDGSQIARMRTTA